MIIYTDNIAFTRRLFPDLREDSLDSRKPDPSLAPIIERILKDSPVHIMSASGYPDDIPYALVVEKAMMSHYDTIIRGLRDGQALPDRLILLAGSGQDFHGQRDRSWAAVAGNIHLVVHLVPRIPIYEQALGFTILAAVSALQAIDTLPGLRSRAMTKWVNDIVIDREKICGVLTYAEASGNGITGAVLGIGLNVETTPVIESSPFVPGTTSLRAKSDQPELITMAAVIKPLLKAIFDNYSKFVRGEYLSLLDIYRRRSAIVGRQVEIHPDSPHDAVEIIRGKVVAIGDNLELYLKSRAFPVTRGRLAILD